MFKSKITTKLTLYFAIALLIFAIIIGSVFVLLFRNQSLSAHKAELENKAVNIADNIPAYIHNNMGGMKGFGMYLSIIADLDGTYVWVVDDELNLITSGKRSGHMPHNYGYSDLPPNAEGLINESFTGKTAFSEDFSILLTEPTLTVSTPIIGKGGDIIGVVLLHSPIKGINEAISQGIIILIISIILALIASFLLSIAFSYSFTKPLAIMKKTALRLSNGEYIAKTHISQDDEIGELALTLDILADRLEIASHESEKLENMRREFIANISHELKTPITVIRGSLEALVDKVVTEPIKVEQYHRQMLNESEYLQRLVGDLLELSKLQSIDFVIDKAEISICEILDDVIRSVERLALSKNINLVLTKDIENCKIVGDYGRIRQMIMIVLDNAVKFSAQKETVEIMLNKDRLCIIDHGEGIPKEDLAYIFERFYKSRSEQNKAGTGLGLAIAKNIADRHDIQLLANSVEGEGATFTFVWNNNSQKEQI